MSGVNGDKSRFNRQRKQKIAQRVRNRALFQGVVALPKAVEAVASAKAKPKSVAV